MMRTTAEWVAKGEGDYDVVCILLRSRKGSRFDAICFHCQQVAEKYLKARLNEAGVRFGKTHDLGNLLLSVVVVEPLWAAMMTDLKRLTDFAVAVRYPGSTTGAAAAKDAVAICRRFRRLARESLGLPVSRR